jgi:ribonuclease-3 family protein
MLSEKDAKNYGSPALAFLGDSVYELWIRNKLVTAANSPSAALHDAKIKYVCAAHQSKVALSLDFTEEEEGVFRRAKNNKDLSFPKNAQIMDYKRATGLEAVLGYLYLTGNTDRIDEIMEKAMQTDL